MNMNNLMTAMPKAANIKNTGTATGGSSKYAPSGSSAKDGGDFGSILNQAGAEAKESVATEVAATGGTAAAATEDVAAAPQDTLVNTLAASGQGSWQNIVLPTGNTTILANNEAYTPNLPLSAEILQTASNAPVSLQSIVPPTEEVTGKSQQLLDMLSGTVFPANGNGTENKIGLDSVMAPMGKNVTATQNMSESLPAGMTRREMQTSENATLSANFYKTAPQTDDFTANQNWRQNFATIAENNVKATILSNTETKISSMQQQIAPGEQVRLAGEAVTAEAIPVVPSGDAREATNRLWGNAPVTQVTETELPADALRQYDARQQFDDNGGNNQQMFGDRQQSGRSQFVNVTSPMADDAAVDMMSQIQARSTDNEQSVQAPIATQAPQNNAPVATQNNQPPPVVRDDYNVQQQIVEQARLLRRGADTEMVIRLKPEHLGDLTLRVSVTASGSVNASFHSDNAQVRMIIENSLVQLKQELADQGIKVDKVEVYTGLADGQMPQGQGRQAWQQNGDGQGVRNMEADMAAFEETAEGLSVADGSAPNAGAADGVDYRV